VDAPETPTIVAAGAVVCRKGPQVLLIHRPKYDDWSFPKGKLDPGEHAVTAAVREVAEETGLDVRLGPPLPDQEYTVGNGTRRPKVVHYWAGRLLGGDDVSGYRANAEVDEVAWVDLDVARRKLTYVHDRETLDAFAEVRQLSPQGELQSDQVVPLLAAYGVRRILSSSSRRCWTTLAPYAEVTDVDLDVTDDLAEEDARQPAVEAVVHDLLASTTPTVLCTHRPVLPLVTAALGLRDPHLEPAGMLVVHHRNGQVVATEQHDV